MSGNVRYLVFDIESVADGNLVARARYDKLDLSDEDAIKQYREELQEKYQTDFIPYTYQIPISIAVAKVDDEMKLLDIVTLDEPQFRPHMITRDFWRGWEAYNRPTLVTFNGRTFDLPLLELAAFRYGVCLANWFNVGARTYEQPRNRYNLDAHLDLHDVLTNFGASRFTGGLNLAANILGKPGKFDVHGYMVQDMYHRGECDEINDYCRCDVLDTYFVFLRVQVMLGGLTIEQEQQRVAEARAWLAERAEESHVYQHYLEHWGQWRNPWQEQAQSESA